MHKKILIQFFLLFVIFGLVLLTFYNYFYEKEVIKETKIGLNNTVETKIDGETGTLIKDIYYSFTDVNGNYYQLLSDYGKVDIKNSDKMFMTNVVATIFITNASEVRIVSKYANYFKNDHETNFFEDVKLTYLEHKTTSENLDLSFKNNLATIYNEIIYTKPGTKIIADRLEIDLITKNSKIFMDNESEKIKIINNK